MNYIKIGGKFINLEAVMYFKEEKDELEVNYNVWSEEGYPYYTWIVGDERAALIAWLNVPNHMAGVIDPLDRDVMAWWQRQQKDKDISMWKPGVKFTRSDIPGHVYEVKEVKPPFLSEHDLLIRCVLLGEKLSFWLKVTDDFKIITDATETEA